MKLLWLVLFLGPIASTAETDLSMAFLRLQANPPSNGMQWASETTFSSRYEETHCKAVMKSKTKSTIGFVCLSSNAIFAKDMGVTIASIASRDATGGPEEAEMGSYVATASSQYRMNRFLDSKKAAILSAEVDCDEGGGPVYRPSSTCHVAATMMTNGVFVYSNFVLKNHIVRKQKARISDVKSIWETIERDVLY